MRVFTYFAWFLLCLLATWPVQAQETPPITRMERGEFAMPVHLDEGTRAQVKELKLYLIGNNGTWRLEQVGAASLGEFRVKLEKPGIYGFRIVAVDLAGRHHPPRLEGIAPQQWVEVKAPAFAIAEPVVSATPTPLVESPAAEPEKPVVNVMPSAEPEKPAVAVVPTAPVETPLEPMPVVEEPKRVRILKVVADPDVVRIRAITAEPERK